MPSKFSIKITNVSKLFHRQNQYTIKELLPAFLRGKQTRKSFWALNKINIKIAQGESFGIVGLNGSGKSTLLKMIAGVSEQTEGSIEVNGRIAPLIELGAGFHPELTGRENIFLNGIILGLKRKEIKERFDKIVEFSELDKFIDQPVKHYSSGMYLRLAYSVAIHTDPDILLIDEILAVGDEAFQKKCLNKVRDLQKQGVSVVIVSHDQKIIRDFTTRVLLLEKGKQIFVGPTKQALEKYSRSIESGVK